jgi:hypothetical protein
LVELVVIGLRPLMASKRHDRRAMRIERKVANVEVRISAAVAIKSDNEMTAVVMVEANKVS